MMKSIRNLILLACCCFAAAMASAQTPEVAITVDGLTATTITASFAPNAGCSTYYLLADVPGDVEQWVSMGFFGNTPEDIIQAWGIACVGDTTYTWTEQIPGQTYVVYALAVGGGSRVICSDTVTLPTGGGSGASVMTVTVGDITPFSATLTCTPNDQTARFKDMLLTKEYYDFIGADSVIAMLKEDYYTYYETDVWTWSDLDFNTEYIMCAIGQNNSDEWGALASAQFTTLPAGGPGASTVAIDSTVLTATMIHIQFVPNDQTARYWVKAATQSNIESMDDAQLTAWLQEEGQLQYSAADFDLTNIEPGVCYAVLAVGQNGSHELGEVARLAINCPTEGVAEAEESPLALYPNPATSMVKVEGLEPQSQVALYDVQGRQLLSFRSEAADAAINLSRYAKGLYLLKVVGNGHTRTATLVVE